MQTSPSIHSLDDPFYRSSDGNPMSDNTKQFDWIVAVQGGLATQFAADPNVLVVGDLLWYPVEANNKIRVAPDAMVILGRPKGHRGSYIQHREAGVTPQVVFEILSPSNGPTEMRRKLAFYEQYGVQEYYILDPDDQQHRGYLRDPASDTLEPVLDLFGWISPLLGIRFEMTEELRIFGTDGLPFEFYEAVSTGRRAERQARLDAEGQAETERQARVEAEGQAETERQARIDAEGQARAQTQRAEAERQETDRLRAKLRALGIDPDA